MTISSTTNRVSYAGDGATTAFSFPHRFLADADLLVILVTDSTGVEATQTLTTDYTVSGAGNANGGTVTMNSAPASGETLVIINDPALKQQSDYVDAAALDAETLEDNVDRLTLIAQRTRVLQERSARFSDGYTGGVSPVMPEPTALRLLRWNSDGDALELVQVGDLGELSTGRTGTDVPTNSDISVASLSDLQAIDPSTVPADFVIYMGGRTSVGDGGEGHFRWDSSDLSTEVSNDEVTTNEGDGGIYVAPTSDKTGASGAWVRQLPLVDTIVVEMYGAKGDSDGTNKDGTDDWPAFDAACNAERRNDSWGYTVLVGEKKYRLSKPLNLKHVINLKGHNVKGTTEHSILRFDNDNDGIIVNDNQTLGDGLDPAGSTTAASGSVLEGITCVGSGTSGHGIRMRATCMLRNFRVRNFPEDGYHMVATAGSADPEKDGNINQFALEYVTAKNNGRDGVHVAGSDANAGVGIGVDCVDNGRWGIYDNSFLGNTWTGPHTDSNGTATNISDITKANPAVVTTASAHNLSTGDRIFIENVSGMTEVNDRSFVVTVLTSTTFELDGEDSSGHTAYSSGGNIYDGGSYYAFDPNQHTVFIGPYSEGNQRFMWIDQRDIAIMGESPVEQLGSGFYINTNELSSFIVRPREGDSRALSRDIGGNDLLWRFQADADGGNGFQVKWNETRDLYTIGYDTTELVRLGGDLPTEKFGRSSAVSRFWWQTVKFFVGNPGREVTSDTSEPSSGEHGQGDVVWKRDAAAGSPRGWVCTSAGSPGTFEPFGQVGHRTNAGDPNSSVTPNFVGEELLDTTNSKWYKSTGTANTDWAALN